MTSRKGGSREPSLIPAPPPMEALNTYFLYAPHNPSHVVLALKGSDEDLGESGGWGVVAGKGGEGEASSHYELCERRINFLKKELNF